MHHVAGDNGRYSQSVNQSSVVISSSPLDTSVIKVKSPICVGESVFHEITKLEVVIPFQDEYLCGQRYNAVASL